MKASIISGNLDVLAARIDPSYTVEDIQVGEFVVVRGLRHKFFAIITGISLDAANRELLLNPPDPEDLLTRAVLQGTSVFGIIEISPALLLDETQIPPVIATAKTIPVHYSDVERASSEDVSIVFGEANEENMEVGTPLGMEIPICLNMDRYIERSNGVFGKTGTGKTFMVRLLLANLIFHERVANLIFDLHNEYGWESRTEDGIFVKGLKQLFPDRVIVFTLDKKSSERRNVKYDFEVTIPFDAIEPEDVLLLTDELNLTPTADEILDAVHRKFGDKWLQKLLDTPRTDIDDLAESLKLHKGALRATHSKLQRFHRYQFLKADPQEDTVKRILGLIDAGKHVVIEFGGYHGDSTANILTSNILTRRIHTLYVKKMEEYFQTRSQEPKRLMITVEEAHKFLTPQLSSQTIFGTIAREMRKYNVVLQIVDQRPSQIDSEVLSQIGTRITGQLSDERDINAVLVGIPRSQVLRRIVESLEPKQQVLIIGHGTPMPVAVDVKPYDQQFYSELAKRGSIDPETARKDLYGE